MNLHESNSFDKIFRNILDSIPNFYSQDGLNYNLKDQLKEFAEKSGVSFDSIDIFRKLAVLLILNRLRFFIQFEIKVELKNLSILELSEFLKDRYPLMFISSPIELIANLSTLKLTESLLLSVKAIFIQSPNILSSFYIKIISPRFRRKLGQFWTPEKIAELMVDLVLKNNPRNILDPCTGPGTFLKVIEKKCSKNGVKVSAIEIHPFLFELTSVNLFKMTLEKEIIYGDFLEENIERFRNRIEGSLALISPRQLDSYLQPYNTKGFDCIICNPPYSRHHILSRKIKQKMGKEIEETFGGKFNRISSLFMYFILKSLKLLLKSGSIIFITPTIVFESRNSVYLKEILKNFFRIPYIIVFDASLNVFPNVDTAACIFMIIGETPRPFDKTKLLLVKSGTSNEEIQNYLFGNMHSEIFESNNVNLYMSNQVELDHKSNWTHPRSFIENNISEKQVKISEFFKVMRGIATGNNKYFTFTEEELKNYKIEEEYVVPTLSKTRYVQKYIFSKEDFKEMRKEGKKSWLLYIDKNTKLLNGLNVQNYLKAGLEQKIAEGSLVKSRKIWYEIEKRDVPPLIFTYLSRGFPRFILNEAGVRPLNTFLIIYPKKRHNISNEFKLIFWAIFNSKLTIQSLREVGRCYGGDTMKIEPKELMEAIILNPYKISKKSKDLLLKCAEELKMLNRSNILNKESIIKKIDDIVREELNNR